MTILRRLRARVNGVWRRLPPAIRAGVTTAWQTFTGSVLLALLGVLDAVRGWIDSGDPPDWSALARVFASTVTALAAGIVTTVYRSFRPPAMSYPDRELVTMAATSPGERTR